jgi:predicted DNA-binding protein with PD1-like motif
MVDRIAAVIGLTAGKAELFHSDPLSRLPSVDPRPTKTMEQIGRVQVRQGSSGKRGSGIVQSKILANVNGQKTYAIVMESGDEVMACLRSFVETEGILAAQFSAIGAFSEAVLKYFDWEAKTYRDIPIREQVEVASLIGDVAESPDGNSALHIHTVLGRSDGSAMAGHLGKANVRPTLEIILIESPAHLRKKHDPESGLALIRMEG